MQRESLEFKGKRQFGLDCFKKSDKITNGQLSFWPLLSFLWPVRPKG